jgi:apolipoprotein N-acyltransferase
VWPEGGSDLSPLTDEYAAGVFDFIVEEMDAPLLAGVITERDGNTYNTQLLWRAGEGAVDFYDKRHPVPFGEYVPERAFFRPFAPDLIDLIGRDYTPGTTDMVMDVDGTIMGVNICFDIVDDQILTETVEQGATVIVASSNNADFGRTDESAQQLAIARIRAIELGRSVVNISTVGISAVFAPGGAVLAQLPWYTVDAMVLDVPLSTTITPAVVLGREFEWLVSGLALAALAGGAIFGRRRG